MPQHDNNDDDDDDDDDESSSEETPAAAKRAKKDNGNNVEEEEEDTFCPTIQLDLTLGVDANHPAMALLDADGGGGGDDDEKESAKNKDGNAEKAIQNLLNRRNQVPGKQAKGPLITEVTKED